MRLRNIPCLENSQSPVTKINSRERVNPHGPVNVADEAQMVREGLRTPQLRLDQSYKVKTPYEVKQLKLMSNKKQPKEIYINYKEVRQGYKDKLTVYLENTTKDPKFKTTYSFNNIQRDEIGLLVIELTEQKFKIKKAYYAGKPLKNI